MAERYPAAVRRLLAVGIAFAFLCFFSYFLSVLSGSGGTPFYYGLSVSALLAVLLPPLTAGRLRRTMTGRRSSAVYRVCRLLYSVGILGFCVTFCVFFCAVMGQVQEPPENRGEAVLLVYGCRTENGQPRRMLRERLDLTLALLEENPEADVIVSGGVDAGQELSEAEIMARYLRAHGIADDRIFLDEEAESTKGNITGFLRVLRSEGMEDRALISVSSEFHLPRIRYLCGKRGIVCGYAGSETKPFFSLFPTMVREYMAYAKLLVLGAERG